MQIKKFKPTDHKVKAVIYGASGSWKTVFGSTAPKPIFASAEGGLLSVADKNIDFVEIKTITDLQELLVFLKTQKHDFETVVIDSITEINDIIKQDIEKRTGKGMQLNDWWELAKRIRNIFRSFRDLPMHVIFLAQEAVELDEGTIVKITPSLNGKAATEISYFMDNVGYLYIDKTGERKMMTNPNSKFLTKNRGWLIGNDTPPDFSIWIEKVKKMKIGEQKVTTNFEVELDEAWNALPEKPKPISEKTLKDLADAWSEMWTLSMEKKFDAVNKEGVLIYTADRNEIVKAITLNNKFKTEDASQITEEQWIEFIAGIRNTITDLQKLPDLAERIKKLEEEIERESADYENACENPTDTKQFRDALVKQSERIGDMKTDLSMLKAKQTAKTMIKHDKPKAEPVAETPVSESETEGELKFGE